MNKSEKEAIDKINEEESKKAAKESQTKSADQVVSEKAAASKGADASPKKQKHSGTVVEQGLTDNMGNYYPLAEGATLPESYKESHKSWVKYKKFSDGSIEV